MAIVGCTGMVGQCMVRVLEERNFPIKRLVPAASEASAGTTIRYRDEQLTVRATDRETFEGVDVALFSAGADVSRTWAPVAAEQGAVVIDNSSAWRMDPEVPLCVPEVNGHALSDRPKGIVANPNCSTIQLVVALGPIHRRVRLRRVVVSTYQAISGAGAGAVSAFREQTRTWLAGESAAEDTVAVLRGQLAGNVLMHWDVLAGGAYQEEEIKMVNETRRILDGDLTGDAPDAIQVSPTCVRVPVVTGHCESVAIEGERALNASQVKEWLGAAPGVRVVDGFDGGTYPTALEVEGADDVMVGRVRDDVGCPGGVQMWVVADNLRKGAATNAVQIAETLVRESML